jgi:pimeloyl-ACP methyl ester carboxylesterase
MNFFKRFFGFLICLGIVFILSADLYAQEKSAVSSDGSKIFYSVYGKGKVCLVFIHGWGGDSTVWQEQIPYFQNKYKLILLDLAGFGKSDKKRIVYTMELFGQDVASVVNAEKVSHVILLGHSMGGGVIVEAANILKSKVIGIIGIDTFSDLDKWCTPEQAREMIQPLREDFKKGTDAFIRQMFVKDTDPKLIDRVVQKISSAVPSVAISAIEQYVSGSFIVTAEKLTVPVWSLNADFWPTNLEGNRKHFKSYDLSIIPGLGHFLMLEASQKFNEELDVVVKKIINS